MWRETFLASMLALITLPVAGKDQLDCSIGRVEKTFGGSNWLVHGCSDGKSVAIVSAKGNPAMPFMFFLFPQGETYKLYGEGTGDRAATKPAYDELSAELSDSFVAALHAEAVASAAENSESRAR